MILRGGVLALLLATPAAPQEAPALSIRCLEPVRKTNRLLLSVQGESRLPERTILMTSLVYRLERWEAGRLRTVPADGGAFSARVAQGKFSGVCEIPAPGVYGCTVQRSDLAQEVSTAVFHAFDDALMLELEPALRAVQDLADRARELLKDFEAATATSETWKAAATGMQSRLENLKRDVAASAVRTPYPAAWAEIHSTIEVAHQNLVYIVFKGDAFDGARDYHAGNNRVKTHQGDFYGHEAFRRYIDEAPAVAGRELGLWVLKDFRRAGNSLRTETAELLTRVSEKPGLAEFAERLAKLPAESAEALERDLRETKLR